MSRQIRVFLSSTFRDLQDEREELVKQVFPGLRRMCRERGVDLVEVDLRWGITEEQAERGEVLPLCIREIDRCRPYFIGILGERYGSVPESLPDAPWALPGASITHIEIHWAALRSGAPTDRSFFFFKRGVEGPGPLEALKAEIRARDLPVDDFVDHEALGARVKAALEAAIELDYPEDDAPSWVELEREAMEAFQETRRRVYVPREAWFARLDAGDSVVVTGESGSGKSALLANWAAQTDESTFLHFFGATPHSVTADRVIHRLLAELAPDVPPDPADHRAALEPALAAAAPVALVLDGIEHLDELSWLPHPLPAGVRLIVSGRPGPALDELERRGYPRLTLTPLTPDEQRRVIVAALARHGKTLNDERLERIVAAPQTHNPLFLRTLTEELRVWGDHEALDDPIDRMLAAADVPALFALVLERFERDYEEDHPGLVGQAMSAIAAARRGLTEPELLEIVQVAPLIWAPLSHALEAWLMSRAGALTFFHDGLRQAVLTRYLPGDEAMSARRRSLAEYFESEPVSDRVAEELPWLLAAIGDHEGLTRSLTDLGIFLHLQIESELQDLVAWWRLTGDDPVEGYRRALEAFAAKSPPAFEHAVARHRVARFLQLVARLEAALPLFDEARALYAQAVEPGDPNLGIIANDHGLALFLAGRFQEAEPLLRQALEITGDVGGILHNLAEILLRRNDVVEAEDVAQRAVRRTREIFGRHEMTATVMQNLGRARMERGDLDGADAVFTEALDMVEGRPTRPLALALSNLGNLRLRQGRLDEAEHLLRRSISSSREVFGADHPHAAATLTALGGTLFFAGKEDQAEDAYREAIDLTERHLGPDHPNLNNALVALANLHLRRQQNAPAEALARRALEIAENEFGPQSIDAANAIQSLSACAANDGRYEEATQLALTACELHQRHLGPNHASTVRSWTMVSHLGRSFLSSNRPAEAEPLLRATLARSERRLGKTHPQIGPDLWNLAATLVELGRTEEAIPLFERELALLETSKGPGDEETVASRQNLAILRAKGSPS